MRVTVVESARPGGKAGLRSGTEEWVATWRGAEPAIGGQEYYVEIEIGDLETWGEDTAVREGRSGIFQSDDSVVVCGIVSAVYKDGVAVLDLEPGSVMVEPGETSRVLKSGQFLCFQARSVCVFPERI